MIVHIFFCTIKLFTKNKNVYGVKVYAHLNIIEIFRTKTTFGTKVVTQMLFCSYFPGKG